MDTSSFSSGLEKLQLIHVQEDLGGNGVHMGESKVFERSTNESLTNLALSNGDSRVAEG